MKSPIRNTDTAIAISCKEIYDDITVKTFLGHKKFLEEIIDSDLEFLKTLLRKGALSRNEARSLSGKRLHDQRNAELLEYITDQEKCHSFINSLRETRQTHIVNYLIGDGIFDDEFVSDWPLTINQIQRLNSSQVFLVDLINISDILNELCFSEVINPTQKWLIDSSQDSFQKNSRPTFLQILRRMSQENFRHVMKCFSETGQSFVAEVLDGDGAEMYLHTARKAEVTVLTSQATKNGVTCVEKPATDIWYRMNDCIKLEMLVRHKTFLGEIVDSSSVLLDTLLSKGMLTRKQIRCIKNKPTYQERNAKLFECITGQEKCDLFIDSLRNTKQVHAINYLIGDGKHNVEFGCDWPLTDTQMQTLNDNQVSLVDLIDTKDLLPKLFSMNVINIIHIKSIYSQESSFQKNEVFLNILRRQSQSDLRQTIKCLRETHQDLIAEILDKGGVLLRIHVNTDAAIEVEDEFVDRLKHQLSNSWGEKGSLIAELKQLKIIAAKADRDIMLYFYCQKLQEFELLQMSLESGRLKDLTERLIDSLLYMHPLKKVNVTSVTADDEVAELRFCELKKRYCNSNSSEKDGSLLLNELPPEVLEMIFQQCYRLSIPNSGSKLLIDRKILENLIAVNFFWLGRMSEGRCRKAAFGRLAEHFQRLSKSYTAVKNNREFLMEFIRPCDELIAKLESAEYLTKEEVGVIKKLRRDRDKTFELLQLLKPFDSQNIETLIRCLRQTKQNRVASVIENGGAVVKITQQNDRPNAVKQMIENLNDLLYQRDPTSKTVKIISDDNIENSFLRRWSKRGIWIWFQERLAFETMKALLPAEPTKCVEYDVAMKNHHHVIPSSVNVDSRQFENKFVSFSIFAEFTGSLDCDQNVRRLTKLKDKIYAACFHPDVIYVFDDRNQFHRRTQLERTIDCIRDMVSCETMNCLYVSDANENCIWKITVEEGENRQLKCTIVKWLERQHNIFFDSLSVTRDGEVVIFNTQGSIPKGILVYGSDAELRVSIQLPEEIRDLQQALKTSNGDFIILHDANKFMELANTSAILERKHMKKNENILVDQMFEKWRESIVQGYGTFAAISMLRVSGMMSSCIDQYIPRNEEQILRKVKCLTIDSNDRLFVPDCQSNRVFLIDQDLEMDRILIPTEQEMNSQNEWDRNSSAEPSRLFYDETNKQLIVVGDNGTVNVYTLTMR